MKKHEQSFDPEQKINRITLLLRRLHSLLQDRNGRSPTYLELEEWTGVAEGTLRDWFANIGRPKAEFLLQLLERVPHDARNRLVNSVCRVWPTLEDPRFAFDQTVRSRLNTIIGQSGALVLIDGGTDEGRTLLSIALANAYLTQTERPRRVRGVDVHEPDWFVPVAGVAYLHNQFHTGALDEAVTQLWPSFSTGKCLVLLNEIWSRLPAFRAKIVELARKHPVVVADTGVIKTLDKRPAAYLITLTEDQKSIRVEIAMT